jgi:hypothetical protein
MKWYLKILDCLFVAIAVWDFYNSLVLFPALLIPALSPYLPAFRVFNLLVTVTTVLFAVLYPFVWHHREKKGKIDSSLHHAWFTGIVRYWLAVEIFNYGFAKILGTQFAPAYFKGDSTWNSLSGYDLTWNYFSYSYAMSCIIAVVQIVGSGLLLFRRTTLLGVFFLLPVMVNIVLIDIFYSIAGGALMNAILFTSGLTYLLLLRWGAIVVFFKQSRSPLPVIRFGGVKNLLRLLLVVYAAGFIYYVSTTKAPADLTGKWRVDQLVRNGETARVNDWLTDSLSWKNIYLEEYGRFTFSPNPYFVESARATIGSYKYEAPKKTIRFVAYRPELPADTLYAVATMMNAGHMQWRISGHKDTVLLSLTKIREDLHH